MISTVLRLLGAVRILHRSSRVPPRCTKGRNPSMPQSTSSIVRRTCTPAPVGWVRCSRAAARALFAASLVCAASAPAAVLAPSRPSELATIYSPNGPNSCGNGSGELGFQILPDTVSVPFAVPPGQVFVLTRLDVALGGSAIANVNLRGVNVATGATASFAYQLVDVSGVATIHFEFPHGIVVKPGVRLCITTSSSIVSVADSYGYGFFTRDK